MKKCWQNLKDYTKSFIKDESGMELLQGAIILAITAGLAVVVIGIFTRVNGYIDDVGTNLEGQFEEIEGFGTDAE